MSDLSDPAHKLIESLGLSSEEAQQELQLLGSFEISQADAQGDPSGPGQYTTADTVVDEEEAVARNNNSTTA